MKRTRRWNLAVVAVVMTLAMSTTTACQPPPTLTVTPVISGLNRPWDLAFTPDGTMLFTEKSGEINALISGAKVTMHDPADSVISGEGGMMGLAVDPAFTTNRRIYVCFFSTLPAGTANDVRVVRFTVNADYTALTDRADIVTGMPVSTGRHSGCRTRFGSDDHLYIGTGDAAIGTNPQNPQSLGGKVLRVDTDGNGVAGNPGVDDPGSGFLPQIFTYGHRNVQGLALDPMSGDMYSVEHGSFQDDEVNRLVAGGNYGWDPVPGYNETVPMTDLVKFPDAIPAVWRSGNPTIAPSGATFLVGDQWDGWNHNLVMAVLKDMQVRGLILDADRNSVFKQDVRITGQGRLRSAVQGPDGNLYLSQDSNPGAILRVVPSG
jgi:glucose/arabinose dehydrogenase